MNNTDHTPTIAGQLPSGHDYCTCGRKLHYLASKTGPFRLAHTSSTKLVAAPSLDLGPVINDDGSPTDQTLAVLRDR